MGKLLFLLFVVVPILETWLLFTIGSHIGFWQTVGIVLLTGAVGAALAKREGLRVLRSWQEAMAQGRVPEEGVLGGLLVLVGGVLLVTPGVITDAVGLSLLIPPVRRWVARGLSRWAQRRIDAGTMHVVHTGPIGARVVMGNMGPVQERRSAPSVSVIDVDGEEIESPPPPALEQ